MNPELKRFIRFAIAFGVVVFLATNLIAMPGWGTDSTGRISDIERHIGWPCEYYSDLWFNDSPISPNPLAFMFVIPLSTGLRFSHSDVSLAASALNSVFAVCFVVFLILFARTVDQQRLEKWVARLGVVVILIGLLIFYLSEHVGAFGL